MDGKEQLKKSVGDINQINKRSNNMSFRKFQKELELKKEEQSMINTLNSTIESLTQKRDEYIKKAKEE